MPHLYETELTDGRCLMAEIHGDSGVVQNTPQLYRLLTEKLQEIQDRDALPAWGLDLMSDSKVPQKGLALKNRGLISHGTWRRADLAGQLYLHTKPIGKGPGPGGTTAVSIEDVRFVRQGEDVLWSRT